MNSTKQWNIFTAGKAYLKKSQYTSSHDISPASIIFYCGKKSLQIEFNLSFPKQMFTCKF